MAAGGLVALVSTGSYRRWERITIVLCLLDLTRFGLALASHSQTGQVLHDTLIPNVPPGGLTPDLVFLVIGIVGTTIAPWQLFFQQSCVADKKLRFKDLKWARLDTFINACFTIFVAGCMMLVGDVGFRHHINFTDPAQLAGALVPFLGPVGRVAILMMTVNASILGATAISLFSS